MPYTNTAFTIYFAAVSFLLGTCIGSFLNVVIYRLPRNINMAKGRSYCPNCEHTLAARDLVPLFSFIFLRGKCRYCSIKISKQYFVVELITGLCYLSLFLIYGLSFKTLLYMLIFSVLIPIIRIDELSRIIPNSLIILTALLSAVFSFVINEVNPLHSALVAVFAAFPYIAASLVQKLRGRQTFGMGDIKLALALGLGMVYDMLFLYMCLTLVLISGKILLCVFIDESNFLERFSFAKYIGISYMLLVVIYNFV